MRRPVFISGRGAVSCYGLGLETLVDGIYSGERGIRPRARTALFRAPTSVAAEIPGECFADTAETDLPYAAGTEACRQALAEARIAEPSSIGLLLGSTKADISGLMVPGRGLGLPARLAGRIAEGLELGCVHASVSTACASGLSAIAMASLRIECGQVERVLVLGVDTLSQFIMAGFGSMHILDPEPCRPFDASRRGISLGEGAGALVLSAHERESVGFHVSGHAGANDAIHISGCDREGGGIALALKRTMQHAGLGLDKLDFLHLHGTGTTANDASEAVGLGRAFDGPTPTAYGTKGQIGHTLGAGGVLESLITLAALERAQVPGNLGLREQGVSEQLQLSRDPVSLSRAEHGMKLASGFGGIQQAVLFSR